MAATDEAAVLQLNNAWAARCADQLKSESLAPDARCVKVNALEFSAADTGQRYTHVADFKLPFGSCFERFVGATLHHAERTPHKATTAVWEAVREAVGAGAQRTPHTLARVIVQCEYEAERAVERTAATAASAVVDASAAGGASRNDEAAPRGAAEAREARVPDACLVPRGRRTITAEPVDPQSAAAPLGRRRGRPQT
jgi:hypothetical protein